MTGCSAVSPGHFPFCASASISVPGAPASSLLTASQRLVSKPRAEICPPDWVATVALLLDAGASLDGITFNPDEPKQPSAAVLELLRSRGLASDTET